MKLLLDQVLPRSTVQHLAAAGIVAEHVGDLGMSRADDAEILEMARLQQAVVVTLDADFHYLLATTPSVIRLRVEGLKADGLASLIAQAVAAAGAVASVTEHRLRIRALPIGR